METVWTSGEWQRFFAARAGARDFGPERGRVTELQRLAIAASIREFQLGESGEGSHLMVAAKAWAERSGDVEYPAALRLFIAEEMRHARELKAFMDEHEIAVLKKSAVNRVFRRVRKLAGLELSIAVLLCAETIALVYYAALANATDSTRLKKLCRQILEDEGHHVKFQGQRLAILRRGVPPWGMLSREGVYHLFFRATLLAVWWHHGRAMQAGGFSFKRFWRESIGQFGMVLTLGFV